jgi:hypothetical protein
MRCLHESKKSLSLPLSVGEFMKRSTAKSNREVFQSTLGELVESIFESALEEFGDPEIAKRLTEKTLKRKLRANLRLLEQLTRPNDGNPA